MRSLKKRLVYTLLVVIQSETNERASQGDNLTHLLLAEPVSDSFVQTSHKQGSNHYQPG